MNSHTARRSTYLVRCRLAQFWNVVLGRRERRILSPLPKIVFTVTNGRSGSAQLHNLFACVEGVCSGHEPEPRFDALMHDVQFDRELARAFFTTVKLPRIARSAKPVYVETSHVFSKGYFDAMLSLKAPFSVVILHRDARDIALSMWRLGSIPGRTRLGQRYYLGFGDEVLTRVVDPDALDDYQMCYWHALETEARIREYAAKMRTEGVPYAEIHADALSREGEFERVLADLEIPVTDSDLARIEAVRPLRANIRGSREEMAAPGSMDCARLEQEVRSAMGLDRVTAQRVMHRSQDSLPDRQARRCGSNVTAA